ncbi:hypothetical protein [Pyxidicoccus sp. MSG2]|uniref:hypothetical protein n=1 Tax=Pyxidicoccus sp. MSG2 TaxID=2996790 RepID=UPI0022701A51|nr:hypothetical protein [Pyxidicoccus sp. MSG2]MCY1023211.1 hypothetical protein [Pyxidicoccus sp. MSG2]
MQRPVRSLSHAALLAALCLLTSVSSALAAPRWGSFKKDQCTAAGLRQHSSVLHDIQGSWEEACFKTGATIEGHTFAQPARCKNATFNMWGEFDVPDESCMPHWGDFKADHCVGVGLKQYSAVLWNIKDFSWEDACMTMPAQINGVQYEHPTRCRHSGLNMWGEFDVPDTSCGPAPIP